MNKEKDLEKLHQLKRKLLSTTNNELQIILANEYGALGNYLVDTKVVDESWLKNSIDETMLDEQKYQKTILDTYKTVFDNFELINEITKKIKELHHKYPINVFSVIESKNIKLSKSEIKELIKDFFAKLPQDINNVFYKMIRMKNISVVNNDGLDYEGICYDISLFDYPRIIINKTDNLLNDVHNLIHEFGHSYELIRNKTNKGSSCYNLFFEVPSILFQKMFNHYLISNNRYQEFGKLDLYEWKKTILVLNQINEFVNLAYRNKQISFNLENLGSLIVSDDAYLSLDEKTFEYIEQYGVNILNYGYVISDIIANNLLRKYLANEKEGLLEIKDFITTMYQYSTKENIMRYALDFESTEEEMKELDYYQKKKFYL